MTFVAGFNVGRIPRMGWISSIKVAFMVRAH